MKRLLVGFLVIFQLSFGTVALAAPNIGLGNGGMASAIAQKAGYSANTNDTSLASSVGKLIGAVLGLVATIFFVLTIYAGILWMTAQGNEEQVTKAQGILRMAIIGLVIALASYGITATVLIATQNASGTYGPPAN